jgi:hypothetical protein
MFTSSLVANSIVVSRAHTQTQLELRKLVISHLSKIANLAKDEANLPSFTFALNYIAAAKHWWFRQRIRTALLLLLLLHTCSAFRLSAFATNRPGRPRQGIQKPSEI